MKCFVGQVLCRVLQRHQASRAGPTQHEELGFVQGEQQFSDDEDCEEPTREVAQLRANGAHSPEGSTLLLLIKVCWLREEQKLLEICEAFLGILSAPEGSPACAYSMVSAAMTSTNWEHTKSTATHRSIAQSSGRYQDVFSNGFLTHEICADS